MSLVAIIILIIIGIVLLILELLVVPGGILGIIAIGMIGFGVYSTYANHGATTGHIMLASSLLTTIAAVVISLKSGAWNRLALHDALDGKTNVIDGNLIKEGDTGIALSDIRPMGSALFGDEKYEVSSEGEKIPVRTPVRILRIEGNKIIVIKTDK